MVELSQMIEVLPKTPPKGEKELGIGCDQNENVIVEKDDKSPSECQKSVGATFKDGKLSSKGGPAAIKESNVAKLDNDKLQALLFFNNVLYGRINVS